MTFRRGFLSLAGGALTAASIALATGFGAGAAAAQEVTLTLHHFLPPQANVPTLVLDVWADKVEEASGGRIKIDRYPSMQLGGKPPELMDQAIDGIADIVWTVVGYTPGRYPSMEVMELPFMVGDARAASVVEVHRRIDDQGHAARVAGEFGRIEAQLGDARTQAHALRARFGCL